MGKADYQIEGYEIFWYSNDHLPAHFNIERRGEWGIKVYFLLSDSTSLNYEIVWQNKQHGPSSKELAVFRQYVIDNKEHLLKEWETKVCITD